MLPVLYFDRFALFLPSFSLTAMPEIAPFAALRYNTERVSLADVVAPPYDVIDPAFQEALYRKHPNNVIRLILNKIDPATDTAENNRYSRSAKELATWKESDILIREQAPALYVYHQVYTVEGKEYTRRGFMCRCKAVPFGEGMVYPHEQTMSGPKMDRLMLTTACKTNFSQIFGLYPDENNAVQQLLEEAVIAGNLPALEATDHLGTLHRMWVVTDADVIAKVIAELNTRPVFIADGHHRYETACNYRKQVAQEGRMTADHPANYVLMVCIAMDDPGLLVLPTHRLFRGVEELSSDELTAKLDPFFTVEKTAGGREAAGRVWEMIVQKNRQNTIGLYTKKDDTWILATLTKAGEAKMDELAPEHHPEWRELGVSILHRLILETILGQRYDLRDDTKKPTYVHLIREVADELAGGDYPVAALVMPATVDHIKTLSLLGDRMPAKSTYFFPKLISGFVFNPLE